MATKDRPRLGRGLKSLLSAPIGVHGERMAETIVASADTPPPADGLQQVNLALIDPNPHQPRGTMDAIALSELAASIKASGILQPIILRPSADGRYQLVAGHRRTEAAKLAGLTQVPALIRADSTDERQAEWALIENIQRQDLNPIDRAKAYRRYLETFNFTHAQGAQRLGEDRATLSNFLRLLDLNPGVQDLISRGLLSAGHAKVLAGVTDPAAQDRFANQAVAEGLSVRKLEELIHPPATASALPEAPTTEVAGHTRTLTAKSPHVVELEQDLSRKLGTKVRIFPSKRKNTGKLVVQYFSLDEFDRIVEKFS